MEIGIFAKTFERDTLVETLDTVVSHGFRHIQFNMQCAGLAPMPDEIDPILVRRIRRSCDERGVVIDALSGTFNMAHPDREVRALGLRRLEVLTLIAEDLGTPLITLCTGSRDPDDMWNHHPDNASWDAWQDLLFCLDAATMMANEHGFLLGIEPAPGNVVSDAHKAREILREVGSDQFGIIFDPANIIDGVPEDHVEAAIGTALAEIGHRIISVHGKDRDAAGNVVPAGQGIVPWEFLVSGLRRIGYGGSIILQGLEEPDVDETAGFLIDVIAERQSD